MGQDKKRFALYEKVYSGGNQRITRHCSVRIEGGLQYKTDSKWRPVLQLIHLHEERKDRIRFGYYNGSENFIARPLEIFEGDIPDLFDGACKAGVFHKDTIGKLTEVLQKYK